MVQKVRNRGRPRQYDPAEALAAARDAFWRAGYQATSLDDLSLATGMNRPSLYNAFGDKHALYLAALKHYRSLNVALAQRVLQEAPSLRAGMAEIYSRAIALYLGDKSRGGGCFIIGTATAESATDAEARAELDGITRDLDGVFAAHMKRAQTEGKLPRSVEITERARLATAIIHSLSLRARGGESRASLKALAESAVDLLAG